MILLFGDLDAAGRAEFTVLNIQDNQNRRVLDDNNSLDIEIPTGLADLDQDGYLDFVYKQSGEILETLDSQQADIGTYQPYFVYTINNGWQFNPALTKTYNEEHYVYAGLKNKDKVRVLYPRNGGKPKIMK